MERQRGGAGLGGCATILIAGAVSLVVSALVSGGMLALYLHLEDDAPRWDGDVETVEPGDEYELDARSQPAGQELSLSIGADEDEQMFQFDVPDDAVAVRVRIDTEADADLDLFVAFGEDDARGEDWWAESVESTGREEVMLYRHDAGGFASAPLFVQVDLIDDDDDDDESDADIPYTLRVDVVRWLARGPHEPGDEIRGRLDKENGYRASFEIRVPEGAEAMRFDLVDVDQDLDLYVSPRADSYDTSEAEHVADTEISRESLLLDRDLEPAIAAGKSLFVTVSDRYPLAEPTSFRLVATAAREAPASIGTLPEWPPLASGRARALASAVELLVDGGGGSGTIVRADGLILTAQHVVDDVVGDAAAVVVAVTLDVKRPARDAFRARVLHVFEDDDLALLQIVSDLYGRPLPRDYRLPVCPVAWSAGPAPGDVLHTLGYPSIGGWTGRGPVTFSTGVMSGFGSTDSGPKIKTDAVISSGSSGGGALDAVFRLVGMPTQTRWETDDGSETLGYITPVTRVPDEWRRLIETPVK